MHVLSACAQVAGDNRHTSVVVLRMPSWNGVFQNDAGDGSGVFHNEDACMNASG